MTFFKPGKAESPDEVSSTLLIKGVKALVRSFTNIAGTSLALDFIPSSWRESRIVFTPKPGRSSHIIAKNFRRTLLKILERLVDRFLREGPLLEHPLNPNQHAYRTRRSTELTLHSAVSYIEGYLERVLW